MNLLVLTILAFCWITPDHYPPWTAFHTEATGFLAAALVQFVFLRWNTLYIRVPAAIAFILILAVSAWIQWWSGLLLYGGDALVVSGYLISFSAAWLWGYQWITTNQKEDLIEYVALFLMLVALMVAFQLAVQWLHLENDFGGWIVDGLPNGRPRANIGQPNQAATTLIMGCVGGAILRYRGRTSSFVMWLLWILLIMAIVVTQSRTALFSAVVLSILFLVFFEKKRTNNLLRQDVVFFLLILLGGAWVYSSIKISGVGAPVAGEQLTAIGTRPQIWKQLCVAVLQKPWGGWGWLQIAAATQIGSLDFPSVEQATFAHNILLDAIVMLGLPIGLFVFSCFGWWFWCRRALIRDSPGGGAVFLLIPFGIHSMLEFPHAYIYFLMVAGVLLGAINAWSEAAAAYVFVIHKSWLLCMALVFGLFFFAVSWEYLAVEDDFRINRFENIRLGETPADYSPPTLFLLTQFDDLGRAMRLRAKPGMEVKDIELLKKISMRYSWARLMFRTALALGLNDRPVEATEQLYIIKSIFGEAVYLQAKEDFIRMREGEYPQLKLVYLP